MVADVIVTGACKGRGQRKGDDGLGKSDHPPVAGTRFVSHCVEAEVLRRGEVLSHVDGCELCLLTH